MCGNAQRSLFVLQGNAFLRGTGHTEQTSEADMQCVSERVNSLPLDAHQEGRVRRKKNPRLACTSDTDGEFLAVCSAVSAKSIVFLSSLPTVYVSCPDNERVFHFTAKKNNRHGIFTSQKCHLCINNESIVEMIGC